MLRINPSADAGYYLGSVNERETPGEWSGILAHELGIESLDHEALRPLLNNRTPEGQRLTPIDQKNRREGYDLTFSEPKSVSIMEQVAGDKRIGQARRDSVDEIMRLLVEPMATTRKGNQRIVTGNLAYLPFDHLLARPENGKPDPNGHVHVVVANATSHKGKRNALEILPVKERAPFIEAAWHALYAEKLKGLGYEIRPTKFAFEIVGVSDQVIRKYSTRTATVENELERRSKSLHEQITGAKSENELRLLEGKVNRLKSPKGKAALGAQIREKKQPLLDPDAIKKDWFTRLTKDEAKALLTLHNRAGLGKEPEPELPVGVLGKALAGLWQGMQKAPERPVIEPETETVDKPAEILHSSLEALLRSDSRVSEEYLLTAALKLGVGQVTLPELQDALPKMDALRVNGQVSTKQTIREETEVTEYAKRGRLKWVKNKVEGLPDAGKLTFPELLGMVREAGDKHLVIAGDAKGQREGQPLRLLREIVGMKPIGEPVKVRKPVQQAIKGFKKAMKRFVMRSITQKEREVEHVRTERTVERGPSR